VEDLPDEAVGRDLHARGAHHSFLLVIQKTFFEIAVGFIGARTEAHGVLHGHRRSLGHVLQHEVGRVAEQRHRPPDPVVDRLAVAEHPARELRRRAHQLERLVAVVGELRQHLFRRRRFVVTLADRLADGRRHEVEELPAPQGIVDDVGVVRGPERRRGEAQVLRHVADVEHRAVALVDGGARERVADDGVAHYRAQAVGADQRRAEKIAFVGSDLNLPSLDVEAGDPRAGAQLDQLRQLLAAVEQGAMDVGAVRDRVRVAEAPGEALVERDVDHLLAAHAVEHEQVLDEHRLLLHQLADAEGVERMPGVGRDLDAGADLAELRRLLEHDRMPALSRQRQRGGEAADAAAGDDHRELISRGGS